MSLPARTWVTGEVVTAGHMNTEIKTNWDATWPGDSTTYQTWAPTYGATLTPGNGVVVARYLQVGSIVHVYFSFDWGTTSSLAAGSSVLVTTPVAAAMPSNDHDLNVVGHGLAIGIGETSDYAPLAVRLLNASTFRVMRQTDSSHIALTSTYPFTWAADDRLQFTATYFA